MIKDILVVGSGGQLGSCIKLLKDSTELNPNYNLTFVDFPAFDLSKPKSLDDYFSKYKFDCIINCAAYTAVDKAETDIENAFLVNEKGPAYLAEKAVVQNAMFIHVSTDYVFDGTTTLAYTEEDKTNPINIYGKSKLAGEEAVLLTNPNAFILRTAWLYSPFGVNFVKSMLNLFKTKEELNIVDDQIGCPTSAIDLARAIIKIIEFPAPKSGIYHFCNSGETSWKGFCQRIANISKAKTNIKGIPTSEYPTPAQRPSFSVMNCEKFATNFNFEIRNWENALDEVLNHLKIN